MKVDEKEASGKNDARTTVKGRKPGSVTITLKWRERYPNRQATQTNIYAKAMLADLSPRGPNGGVPQELEAEDQEIHNAYNVIIKDLTGPVRTGSGEATATLVCSTWAKQNANPVTKTPDKATAWGTKPGPAPVDLVPDPPGFQNASTAPKAPQP